MTCKVIFNVFNFSLVLQNFLIYAAAFYGNVGNYKSFGDTKFVPDLPKVSLLAYNVLLLESFMKFSFVELKKNLWFNLTWFCFSVFFFCSVCDSVGKIGKCSFLK